MGSGTGTAQTGASVAGGATSAAVVASSTAKSGAVVQKTAGLRVYLGLGLVGALAVLSL